MTTQNFAPHRAPACAFGVIESLFHARRSARVTATA